VVVWGQANENYDRGLWTTRLALATTRANVVDGYPTKITNYPPPDSARTRNLSIASFPSGRYVVVLAYQWISSGEWDIVGLVFDSDDSLLESFTVTSDTELMSYARGLQPKVEAIYSPDGDDRFVVVWAGKQVLGDEDYDIYYSVLEYNP
jgi:hypothetical protein